ncbi:hypothetical protein SLS53_008802 [Cytospora paraplurivora]|uniref:P-loop containing nucleoside triphosphate hydrolase n=1 Tax=Cytospora paraplurivora TaxID=2898453 RepID=A0AAN9YCF9_9PEZI
MQFEFGLPNLSVNGKGTPPVGFSKPHTSSTSTAAQPKMGKEPLFDFDPSLATGSGQDTSSTDSTGSDSTLPVTSAGAAVEAEGSRPLAIPSGSLAALMKQQAMERRRRLLGRPDTEHENVHEITTAPIFTETARNHAETHVTSPDGQVFSQYGLLAGDASEKQSDELYYYNVAAPSSIFICGSQGSGKSHTLSCLLENCLFSSDANELPRPLTGLVFHYDTFVNDREGSPCEAAFLSSNPMVKVRVLCAPTNIATIRRTYARLPNVTIEPLSIKEQDLTTKRMMDLMAVKRGDNIPLYMHVINRILRDLRLEQQRTGTSFKYQAFKAMLDREDLTDSQRVPLQQRLETLESFMAETQTTSTGKTNLFGPKSKVARKPVGNDWTPRAGQLTIVDLSCPCVTAEGACSLFNICLSLFLEQDSTHVGRIIALDEAHKYMNESGEASALTELLLSTIRLQRHLGARVIISTQEPTVSPKLLDLCSATIVHRFTSPEWLRALQKHLAGVSEASRLLEQAQGLGVRGTISPGDEDSEDEVVDRLADGVGTMKLNGRKSQQAAAVSLFAQIVELHVGEALLFSPNAILDVGSQAKLKKLSNGVLKVRIRSRVTLDGGRSVMAG